MWSARLTFWSVTGVSLTLWALIVAAIALRHA